MAYVERGVVKSRRSFWRLSTMTRFFSAIVNLIGAFFVTMFSDRRKGIGGFYLLATEI